MVRIFFLSVCLAVLLGGCGAAYVSPRVTETPGELRVVPMTQAAIMAANSTAAPPRRLPPAFSQTAQGGVAAAPNTPVLPSLTAQERPQRLATRIPPRVSPNPYQIGIGDVLLLATRTASGNDDALSGHLAAPSRRQGYTVQDDGAIAVPDIGRVMLAGLTLEEAEAALFQSLVANRIEPTFSIEIAEFNSKRVSIGGAVGAPSVVPITLTPLLLDEALTRSGGVTAPEAAFAAIRIYREGTLYQIPFAQYLAEPALQKTPLVAGDSVFVDTVYDLEQAQAYFAEQITLAQFAQNSRTQALVTLTAEMDLRRAALAEQRSNFQESLAADAIPRDFVYLTGEVTAPGRFALPFERHASLADALFAEGGFSSETGNPSQIYVLRSGTDTTVTALHLDARNVGNLVLATRLIMQPNDIVFIAEQPVTRWNRVVQQLVPSLITSGAGLAAN